LISCDNINIEFPKRRKSYTREKKLEIVEYAEKNGNRSAARQFETNEKSVRQSRQQKSILQAMRPTKRSQRRGKEHWNELEIEVKNWIKSERKEGRRVSTVTIILKAKEIAEKNSIVNFKGSQMWCHRFMRRHRLSVRAVTSVGQKLPVHWEEKMASFKLFVENAKSGVELQHFGNMDEVPVSFHITSNYTVDEKGSQDIRISTTGNEKCNFTVVLCVTADGGKCTPMVIFKRKTMPKETVINI
jgi:transposase-like protein